jgi:hypothetical protein
MYELAVQIMSLAKAHNNGLTEISTSWFDNPDAPINQAAVIMLLAAWNDAIDWAQHVLRVACMTSENCLREFKD